MIKEYEILNIRGCIYMNNTDIILLEELKELETKEIIIKVIMTFNKKQEYIRIYKKIELKESIYILYNYLLNNYTISKNNDKYDLNGPNISNIYNDTIIKSYNQNPIGKIIKYDDEEVLTKDNYNLVGFYNLVIDNISYILKI